MKSSETANPRSSRLTELDSLRGLAALSVVFAHYLHLFPTGSAMARAAHAVGRTPIYLAFAGHEAVLLFFLLSGFVLALPFLGGRPMDYSSFVIRRIFRIWVPYAAAVALAAGLNALLYRAPLPEFSAWFNRSWAAPVSTSALAHHFLLVGSFDYNQFNPAFWSLVHEMRVSLLFPFIVAALSTRNWKFALATAMALSCGSAVAQRRFGGGTDYLVTPHYLAFFIVGLLLARHRESIGTWLKRRSHGATWALAGGAVAAYAGGRALPFIVAQDWLIAGGAAGFILLALHTPWTSRFLNRSPIRFLGEISYSLYLVHAALLLAAVHAFQGRIPLGWVLAGTFAVTLPVAWLSHRFIEQPAIQAGRWLCERLSRSTRPLEVRTALSARPDAIS